MVGSNNTVQAHSSFGINWSPGYSSGIAACVISRGREPEYDAKLSIGVRLSCTIVTEHGDLTLMYHYTGI